MLYEEEAQQFQRIDTLWHKFTMCGVLGLLAFGKPYTPLIA